MFNTFGIGLSLAIRGPIRWLNMVYNLFFHYTLENISSLKNTERGGGYCQYDGQSQIYYKQRIMKGVVQITCRPSNRNSSRPARKVTKGILAGRLQNDSLTEERSVVGLNTWGRSWRKISLLWDNVITTTVKDYTKDVFWIINTKLWRLVLSSLIDALPSLSVSSAVSAFPAGRAARVTTLPAKISGDQRLRYRCL